MEQAFVNPPFSCKGAGMAVSRAGTFGCPAGFINNHRLLGGDLPGGFNETLPVANGLYVHNDRLYFGIVAEKPEKVCHRKIAFVSGVDKFSYSHSFGTTG